MKICMLGAAVLLLVSVSGQAADKAGAGRQTAVSVFAAENLAVETELTATWFPEDAGPGCVTSDWHQFQHGCLWDDYCLQKQVGMAAGPIAASYPPEHRASWLSALWPWRRASEKTCRTCRTRRTPALDALCNLLGWKRCTTYRVACHARVDCPEPVGSFQFDDPAPLPPTPPPPPTPDELLDHAIMPDDPQVSETPPLEPVPLPEETLDLDETPDEMELSPAPADDPAPEPDPAPEIPRNKLPKPQPAHPGTSRAPNTRTAVAVRLSDYIRTR